MNFPTAVNAKTNVRNLRRAREVLGRDWKHLASRRYHSSLCEPSMVAVESESDGGSGKRYQNMVSFA